MRHVENPLLNKAKQATVSLLVPMFETCTIAWCETPQGSLSTIPVPFLRAVGMMAPPLMSVPFFALGDGFLDFFPGEPIGGIPVTRLAGVGRANQRWGKNEPARSLVERVLAALCEPRYERRDGKRQSAKEDDHSYAHRCSPGFDCVLSSR